MQPPYLRLLFKNATIIRALKIKCHNTVIRIGYAGPGPVLLLFLNTVNQAYKNTVNPGLAR